MFIQSCHIRLASKVQDVNNLLNAIDDTALFLRWLPFRGNHFGGFDS